MPSFFAVLLSALLWSSAALAGGGGCDGECEPPPPDVPQVLCRVASIDKVDRAAAEISPKVAKIVRAMLDGFQLQLRGDATRIFATTVRVAGDSPEAKPREIHFSHYGPADLLQREPLAFVLRQHYRVLWSWGYKDPRPLVTALNYELIKGPRDTTAKFRLLQYGEFNPKESWRSSFMPLLDATLECRAI